MGIDNITSKIICEAGQKADDILTNARVAGDAIIAEAENKADRMLETAEKNGRIEKEKLIVRKKSVAYIDGRKMLLEKKQEIIKSCFDRAVDKIVSMEKEDYISFIADLVEQTGETEGSLILNDADREKIGRDLIRHLNEYIDGGNFVMHDKTKAIRGGFILVKGPVSINCTIENLVDEAREELTGKAAEQLFR